MQIFFESLGFINMAFYLKILRYSATHPTANLKALQIQTIAGPIIFAGLILMMIKLGPKIGLESSLTCGVKYDEDYTQYTELLRNWELFLVPYMMYKCFTLTTNLPGFIEQSFSYYAL